MYVMIGQGRSENFQEGVSSLKCFKEKIGNTYII